MYVFTSGKGLLLHENFGDDLPFNLAVPPVRKIFLYSSRRQSTSACWMESRIMVCMLERSNPANIKFGTIS